MNIKRGWPAADETTMAVNRQVALWYKQLTGHGFPDPLALDGLARLGRDLWATAGVTQEVLVGFPNFLAVDPDLSEVSRYRILAFSSQRLAGRAVYYSAVDEKHDMRLRLPLGSDAAAGDRVRQASMSDLARFTELRARVERLPLRSEIWADLGRYRVALYPSVEDAGTTPLFISESYQPGWMDDVDAFLRSVERLRLN